MPCRFLGRRLGGVTVEISEERFSNRHGTNWVNQKCSSFARSKMSAARKARLFEA
jgi:hypothetical protein